MAIDGNFLASLETLDLYIKNALNGGYGGSRKTKKYGSSVEFADYRDYTRGDDLRMIDWNAYARFDKYYIKQFYDERQLHIKIYIDTSRSMTFGNPAKSIQALKLAAAFGYLAVSATDRVSFILLKEKQNELLTSPIVGRDAFYNAFGLLGQVEFSGDTDLDKSIKYGGNSGYGDGLSIIISDFLTNSDWRSSADYILHNRRDVALVQVLSPEELNPELSGKFQMNDSEALTEEDGRNIIMPVNRAAIKAYKKAVEYMKSEMKSFCAKRNAGYMSVRSDEKIEDIILKKGTEAEIIR